MLTTPSQPSNKLDKRIWVPLAVAFLAGMLVHSTVYMGGLVNPDGLWNGEFSMAGPWEVSLGRWALYFVDILHAGINAPVLIAFLTVLYMALAGTLLASLFQVKSLVKAAAMAAVLTCSPMVAMFITYPYCGDAYALSILLGVLAVYAVHAISGPVKGTIVSALCVALLMGLYQSSLGVMLAVAAGFLLMRLLRQPEEIKAAGKITLQLCIATIAGLVLYYGLMRLSFLAWNVSLADYKGAGTTGFLGILQNIPSGIRSAYTYFRMFFLQGFDYLAKNAYYTNVLYIILAAVALVALVLRMIAVGRKRPYIPVLCALLLAVLPIACNVIMLMIPNTDLYLLMVGGMLMVVPLLIAITDLNEPDALWARKALSKGGAVLAIALVWVFTLSSLTDASVLQTNKTQIVALANRVWQQVEASEGYVPDETPVLIAGHPQEGHYPNPSHLVDRADAYTQWGMVWAAYEGNLHTWAQVYRQYLGVTYAGVTAQEYEAISTSAAFRDMPLYPEAGSVQTIDGVLVVKLSDTAGWAN